MRIMQRQAAGNPGNERLRLRLYLSVRVGGDRAVDLLRQRGHSVHAPLRKWLRPVMLARSDPLYGWSQAQLSLDEPRGCAGSTPTQDMVRDALDAYSALGIELEPLVSPDVHRWYCERD
jgi:hypothetical protein